MPGHRLRKPVLPGLPPALLSVSLPTIVHLYIWCEDDPSQRVEEAGRGVEKRKLPGGQLLLQLGPALGATGAALP